MNVRHSRLLLQELSRLRDEERHIDFHLTHGENKTECHKVVLAVFSQRAYDVCMKSSVNELSTVENVQYLIQKLYHWEGVSLSDFVNQISRPAEDLSIGFLVKSQYVSCLEVIERARLRVFSEGILEFWKKDILTDVILKVNEKVFRCHKIVLAALSPYFDAMFSSGMKETDESAVELHGFDASIIGKIISYIYTGDSCIDNTDADLIFAASVYFQIKPLQSICARYIFRHTNLDNCVDVLAMADSSDCEQLVNNVTGFIKENIIQLFQNGYCKKLNARTLANLVSSEDLIVPDEIYVLNLILQWFEGQESQTEGTLLTLLKHVDCPQIDSEILQNFCQANKYLQQYPSCKKTLLDDDRGKSNLIKFRKDEVLLVVRPNNLSDHVDVVCYSFMQNVWFSLNRITNFKAGGSPGLCFHEKGVFISGGSGNLVNFVKYDCCENEWKYLRRMNSKRFSHCMCGIASDIFIIGGKSMHHHTFNSIEKYSMVEDAWSKEGTLLIPVADASCACAGSDIFVFGGSQNVVTFTPVIQCYNVTTKACTEICHFPKGVLTGIMKICSNGDYFYHVTAEGRVLQSSRSDPWTPEPRVIGTIMKGLMMTEYSVVFYKDSLLLVSDTKTAQGESKVIRYGISENKRLFCDIKQLPYPPDSNQYFAVITNISKKYLIIDDSLNTSKR